jgi:hypothetical protein
VEELRYLTPRILECQLRSYGHEYEHSYGNWYIEPELLAQKFYQVQWWTWEKDMVNAMQDFFFAVWQVYVLEGDLTQDNHSFALESWVCFFGSALPSWTPYLEKLLDYPAILEHVYTPCEPTLRRGQDLGLGTLWNEWCPNRQELVDFLLRPEVENTLLAWYETNS